MVKIYVKRPFRFAVDGINVITIGQGQQDVSERCADVALAEGWATKRKQRASADADGDGQAD